MVRWETQDLSYICVCVCVTSTIGEYCRMSTFPQRTNEYWPDHPTLHWWSVWRPEIFACFVHYHNAMYSIVATLGQNYINEYYIPYLHTATMFTVRNRQTRVEYVTVRVVIGEVVWNERHMSIKRLNSQITSNCSYCSVCSTACLGHSAYNKQLKAPRYWLFPPVTGVFPSRRQGERFHVITPSVAPFTNMD